MKLIEVDLPSHQHQIHLYLVYKAYIANDKYNVYLSHPMLGNGNEDFIHMRVQRIDKQPITNFDTFQQIKNAVFDTEITMISVLPAESELAEHTNNMYHFFTYPGIEAPKLKEYYFYTNRKL